MCKPKDQKVAAQFQILRTVSLYILVITSCKSRPKTTTQCSFQNNLADRGCAHQLECERSQRYVKYHQPVIDSPIVELNYIQVSLAHDKPVLVSDRMRTNHPMDARFDSVRCDYLPFAVVARNPVTTSV